MRVVTWILRIISMILFGIMCYLVYDALRGYWSWDAPYVFIVTVFRLLSFLVFFIASVVLSGFSTIIGAGENTLVVGLYNTIILKQWYMQPYGVDSPLVTADQVFAHFAMNLDRIIGELWDTTFVFLYFLGAGIGIALFLQSLYRMEHKYVGGAFISIQSILIVAAYRSIGQIVELTEYSIDFVVFFLNPLQLLALVSFAYLEISYQMIYSHSVGKPIEDREETLKKQLLALRQATRKQDAIERGDRVSTTGMSRSTGATAFSFLREAIERKVIGSTEALQNLDAVSDVRRLQNFVDDLLASDSNARNELTAKAAAPSGYYVIGSTILGSVFRLLAVISVSFLLLTPEFFLGFLTLPVGVENSVALSQPEIVLLFMVPVVLLFPFVAAVVSWISRQDEGEKLTREQKRERKERERERERMKKEAEKARRERERARRDIPDEEGRDEWDKALDKSFSSEELE